jgi:hypothetical protein
MRSAAVVAKNAKRGSEAWQALGGFGNQLFTAHKIVFSPYIVWTSAAARSDL